MPIQWGATGRSLSLGPNDQLKVIHVCCVSEEQGQEPRRCSFMKHDRAMDGYIHDHEEVSLISQVSQTEL